MQLIVYDTYGRHHDHQNNPLPPDLQRRHICSATHHAAGEFVDIHRLPMHEARNGNAFYTRSCAHDVVETEMAIKTGTENSDSGDIGGHIVDMPGELLE